MTAFTIPAMVASGAFSNNSKTEPVAHASLTIDIPVNARSALEHASRTSPLMTPPLLSSSASSTASFDSFAEANVEVVSAATAGADVRTRRLSQAFFFPNQTQFESAVPFVVRAKDIHLKDHPFIEGAHTEYERLYNADSLMTKDGRPMVRLL